MKHFSISSALVLFCTVLLVDCSKKGTADPGTDIVVTPPVTAVKYIDTLADNVPLKHPGGLVTSADFDRIKANVNSNTEPWISAWNKLIANAHASLNYSASPTVKLIRGGGTIEEPDPDNYSHAFNDVAAAFQLAIRWKVTGNTSYAEKSIQILNAWASTCVKLTGDPNVALASGLYGYQFAVAGELMRDYAGWSAADFKAYQQWMLNVFYSQNHSFLVNHQGSCVDLFWSNWDLCNLASTMAIGILTDKRVIYNEAMTYLMHGKGDGNMLKAINNVFTGDDAGLAQLQESGRDQGHATLVIATLGPICQMAWNQGDDLFGFDDNLFLKACEYEAKYNVASLPVPFHSYDYYNCQTTVTQTVVSSDSRGTVRPMWELPYNHYAKLKSLTATYTKLGVQTTQPEGAGGDYGPNSGGYDQLGCGTLLFNLP